MNLPTKRKKIKNIHNKINEFAMFAVMRVETDETTLWFGQ